MNYLVPKRSEKRVGGLAYLSLRAAVEVDGRRIGIEFMNSPKAENETYVVKRLAENGKEIWHFNRDAKLYVPEFNGRILFDKLDGVPILIWDSWAVIKVISIQDILNKTEPSIERQVALKKAVAEKWGWKIKFSEEEKKFLD